LQLSDEPVDYDNRPDKDIVFASPLHLSVIKKRPKMVRWLLDNNARLDVPSFRLCSCSFNSELWYPLHFAICHSNDEVLSLLLNRGAFYSGKNSPGLYCAVTSGSLSAVDLLTQLDSFDPEYRGSSSQTTALHWVRRCVGMETAGAITEILAQRSVPLNLQDDEGRTGLNYFVTRVMLEPAMVLLRHGVDSTISRGNDRGMGILKFCFGRLSLREIQRGWGFKLSNRRAFIKKPLELAELIIKGGVDVNGHIGHGGCLSHGRYSGHLLRLKMYTWYSYFSTQGQMSAAQLLKPTIPSQRAFCGVSLIFSTRTNGAMKEYGCHLTKT
jgi:ankyrin repeat protein